MKKNGHSLQITFFSMAFVCIKWTSFGFVTDDGIPVGYTHQNGFHDLKIQRIAVILAFASKCG